MTEKSREEELRKKLKAYLEQKEKQGVNNELSRMRDDIMRFLENFNEQLKQRNTKDEEGNK